MPLHLNQIPLSFSKKRDNNVYNCMVCKNCCIFDEYASYCGTCDKKAYHFCCSCGTLTNDLTFHEKCKGSVEFTDILTLFMENHKSIELGPAIVQKKNFPFKNDDPSIYIPEGAPFHELYMVMNKIAPFLPVQVPSASLLQKYEPKNDNVKDTHTIVTIPAPNSVTKESEFAFHIPTDTVIFYVTNGFDETKVPSACVVRLKGKTCEIDLNTHLVKYLVKAVGHHAHVIVIDLSNGTNENLNQNTFETCYELVNYACSNSRSRFIMATSYLFKYKENIYSSMKKCFTKDNFMHFCSSGDDSSFIKKDLQLGYLPASEEEVITVGSICNDDSDDNECKMMVPSKHSNFGPAVDLYTEGPNSVYSLLNIVSMSASVWNSTKCSKPRLIQSLKKQLVLDKYMPRCDFNIYTKMVYEISKQGPTDPPVLRFIASCRICRAPRCSNQLCCNAFTIASRSIDQMLQRRCTKQNHTIFNVLLCNQCKFCAVMSNVSCIKHCSSPMRLVCDLCGEPVAQAKLQEHKQSLLCKAIAKERLGIKNDQPASYMSDQGETLRIPNREEQEKLLLKTFITYFEMFEDANTLDEFLNKFRIHYETKRYPEHQSCEKASKSDEMGCIPEESYYFVEDERQYFELFLPLNNNGESRQSSRTTSV